MYINLMRLSMVWLCLVATVRCEEGGSGRADQAPPHADLPSLLPQVTITGIYEYIGPECTGATRFGDAPLGCIYYVQLVRFSDDSAFYSVSAEYVYSMNGFLPPDTTTFTRDHPSGGSVTYRLTGSLTPATPSLEIYFDSNDNFSDTAPKVIGLVEQ